jgi:hypothetical protein
MRRAEVDARSIGRLALVLDRLTYPFERQLNAMQSTMQYRRESGVRVIVSVLLIVLVLATTMGMVWHHHDQCSAGNCTLCHMVIAPPVGSDRSDRTGPWPLRNTRSGRMALFRNAGPMKSRPALLLYSPLPRLRAFCGTFHRLFLPFRSWSAYAFDNLTYFYIVLSFLFAG